MLPLVLPPVITGYVLLRLLGRSSFLGGLWESLTGERIAYTTSACVIAAGVVGFPLFVEGIRLSILGIDRRLELVSRSLGRGRISTFLRVTLPLSLPGVLAGAVLSFARALGEFGATIVLAGNVEGETNTIPVAVYTLMNRPDQEAAVVRLVGMSVAVALAALLGSVWLGYRQRRRAGHGD
jgi:molybdate transport system permease protein